MSLEESLRPPSLDEVFAARAATNGVGIRTPLLRLYHDGDREIYLKTENLQPIGSFKLRGAANSMAKAAPEELREGVYTASAGNWAQGVCWVARTRGVEARIFVPEDAPATKIDAIRRLGGSVVPVPFEEWWRIIINSGRPGERGLFLNGAMSRSVMAGDGVIGLEIAEDLPDVEAVLVPIGSGGLACGIAAALRAVQPQCAVFGCEVETGAPLAAALAAGRPTTVPYRRSFVDGIGCPSVLEPMWPVLQELIAQSLVVSLHEVEQAIRALAGRRVIAEGAGAASVAAALFRQFPMRKVVCVISGGNIDMPELCRILGEPRP